MEIFLMSKQNQLLKNLQNGKELTAAQIKGSFRIAHPASAVRNLREQGYAIYSNASKLADGTPVTKYRLGQPSKRMVRIANAVFGASIFTAQK
jgi:predicted transcriptional regulator